MPRRPLVCHTYLDTFQMSAKVLVVDDSATVRQQVNAALRQAGFVVSEAVDGEDGKTKIDAGGIDCVICDVNMPNTDGLQMLEQVKAKPMHKKLPVIMLTTEASPISIQRAKAAGAFGWIVNPF